MSLGEKLLKLRKKKGLSQEEVADILHVTRQTVSKWETNQSMPDFDKVVPICNLYEISTEELFHDGVSVSKNEENIHIEDTISQQNYHRKKALFTTVAVTLYILSVVVIIFFSTVLRSPIVGICVFFLVIAVATGLLIYIEMMKPFLNEQTRKKVLTGEDRLYKQITSVLALLVLAIYLIVSILTMAWGITWILWIVYALLTEIIKLSFSLKGVDIHAEDE
ncbi:MAG TPA: helix-turn-helix transcriptional regulator [Candidatus Faecimonas gallistercoris]|nr:helix-turn-helix transcriptional regulator [Candidatus Faecimonas gallistercoris]